MKKSILALAASTFITVNALTSCNHSQKVESVQNNATEVNKDTASANEEYLTDIDVYKKEMMERIAANDKSIHEFTEEAVHEKKEVKADITKKADNLKQKNSEMKKKINNYKAQGKQKWELFKTGFNHDMSSIAEAFKNLTDKKK